MKFRIFGLTAILFIFTIGLFGCNSEAKKKDKLASFMKQYMEWMKTDDFKQSMMDPKKGEAKFNEMTKKLELTEQEIKDLSTKYKDDPEIKKLNEDIMKLMQEIDLNMQQEMQKQAPQGDSTLTK
jgi:hypothetical protein